MYLNKNTFSTYIISNRGEPDKYTNKAMCQRYENTDQLDLRKINKLYLTLVTRYKEE